MRNQPYIFSKITLMYLSLNNKNDRTEVLTGS